MGFEMDQEISGVFPVCRFVFQMNFDSVVVCSYLWLLKDNLCCEYRCFHGPSVSPMYVLVSSVGVVTVALYITLCVLQLPCSTVPLENLRAMKIRYSYKGTVIFYNGYRQG